MPIFTPNPNAEANLQFDVIKPGVYRMRIQGSGEMEAIKPFTAKSGSECIRVRLEYVDPSSLTKLDGSPASNPGSLLDSSLVISPPEKQGKLRSLVEAAGLDWATMSDTDTLIGRELDVKVDIEIYNNEQKNNVRAYLKGR